MHAVKTLTREPLLQFLLLGAALFAVYRWHDQHSPMARILMTRAEQERIVERYRRQFGAAPSPAQLIGLVEKEIEEEMFYRQALVLGLDKDDEIVRRRLIQKYQFLLDDLATPPAPTDAELQAFYGRHASQYREPERIAFSQVYFSPDHRGDAAARAAAERLAAELNRRGAAQPNERGDPFPGPAASTPLTREELQRIFGREGLANDVFKVDAGRWSNPLRSGYGWHTVYVTAHDAARTAGFATVRDEVRDDYLAAVREQHAAEAIAKLRTQFTIVRE